MGWMECGQARFEFDSTAMRHYVLFYKATSPSIIAFDHSSCGAKSIYLSPPVM